MLSVALRLPSDRTASITIRRACSNASACLSGAVFGTLGFYNCGCGRDYVKNRIFIALVVISNTVGTVMLGRGMSKMPKFVPEGLWRYMATFLTDPWILFGILLLIVWMVAQLSMFTWADLSYVMPVTASYYILTALLSRLFLAERISPVRWAGIVVISLGVMLVSETPPRMKSGGAE
jgi:drug/metabolite transporter (DMT)-like permease